MASAFRDLAEERWFEDRDVAQRLGGQVLGDGGARGDRRVGREGVDRLERGGERGAQRGGARGRRAGGRRGERRGDARRRGALPERGRRALERRRGRGRLRLVEYGLHLDAVAQVAQHVDDG